MLCVMLLRFMQRRSKNTEVIATQVVVGQINSLGHIKIERLQGREIIMTLSDCSIGACLSFEFQFKKLKRHGNTLSRNTQATVKSRLIIGHWWRRQSTPDPVSYATPDLELTSKIQTLFQNIRGFLICTQFSKPLPCPLETNTSADNLLKFRQNRIFLDILIIPLSILFMWSLKDKYVHY